MKKLRLLLWEDCNRRCRGCCNGDWDLPALPSVSDVSGYDIIMLTGGEPMLYPDRVENIVKRLRQDTDAKIFMYTAAVEKPHALCLMLKLLDGITVTLHNPTDSVMFERLYVALHEYDPRYENTKSLRLNIFDGVPTPVTTEGWLVKSGIKWISQCPLPADEEFMRVGVRYAP